jgi:hypothetical protein
MAEIKNTFLKSKMNKDLDDRIMPNGEYRDALDIIISESENGNVGTVQSILGNKIAINRKSISTTIIGSYFDSTNNRIFLFETDHEGNDDAPSSASCRIMLYDLSQNTLYRLVSGSFLNFSTQNYIYAINVLENLLFWVDDRNQPRKINIDSALLSSTYYTKEEHISVAKYSPYQPITLIRSAVEPITTVVSNINLIMNYNPEIFPGATILSTDSTGVNKITADDYIIVSTVTHNIAAGTTEILITTPSTTQVVGDIFYFFSSTMVDGTNNGNTEYAGDPEFLKSKFVRFSYRFQFDDNEYSLMAPFTQIAFVPNQKGYFFGPDATLPDGITDQEKAYESTIVRFMENFANKITLMVPLPCKASNLQSNFKVKNLEVLYKESDQISIKVLDEISISQIELNSGQNTFYSYEYQSRKPIKTLPQSETTRVFDQVPVKAQSQEIISNRVVYGNYQNKHTAPASINYNVVVDEKNKTTEYTNYIEYPFHSLKQNRNYQVGFVLSDKYGRSSGVILSTVDNGVQEAGVFYKGSTIYSPYFDSPGDFITNVRDWRGNAFLVRVNDQITSVKNTNGSPGLYAAAIGNGFDLDSGYTATISGNTYTFKNDTTGFTNIPTVGSYLRGAYIDYVKVVQVTNLGSNTYEIDTDGEVSSRLLNSTNTPDTKFSYNINPLGWYSYKVVVKQTEQDYYNVYLPGIISGYPETNVPAFNGIAVGVEQTTTAHIVLLSDNINKVPRDLSEVGPDQIQYRSSVRLYGRIENQWDGAATYNTQYYPGAFSDEVTQIMTTSESGFISERIKNAVIENYTVNPFLLYNFSTNPLIAKVSTKNQIGVNRNEGGTVTFPTGAAGTNPTNSAEPFLAVYETDAFESVLDIFYESSTSGLISDINEDVLVQFAGPVGWEDATLEFDESKTGGGGSGPDGGQEISPDWFYPIDTSGSPLLNTSASMTAVTSAGVNVTSFFNLVQSTSSPNTGKYKIFVKPQLDASNPFIYDFGSSADDEITFNITVDGVLLPLTVALKNLQPTMTQSDGTAFNNDPANADYTITDNSDIIDVLLGDNEGTGNASLGVLYTVENQGGIPQSSLGTNNLYLPTLQDISLGATAGELAILDTSTIPNGTYGPTIRITDAVDTSNNSGPTDGTANNAAGPERNSLYKEYIVYIKKGYPEFNNALQNFYGFTNTQTFGSGGSGTNLNGYVGFYLSTTSISPTDFSGLGITWNYNQAGLNANPMPLQVNGSQNLPSSLPEGSQFEIQATLGASLSTSSSTCSTDPTTKLGYYKTYYRPNSSSSWTEVANKNSTYFAVNCDQRAVNSASIDQGDTHQYQHWMGLKMPNSSGQYLFVYRVGYNAGACPVNTDITVSANADVVDLRYDQGVAGVDYVQVALYENSYRASINTSDVCPTLTGSPITLYTDTTIAKAVTQLYTDNTLLTTYDPSSGSGSGAGWYTVNVSNNPGEIFGSSGHNSFMYINSNGTVDTFTNQTGACTGSNDFQSYYYPRDFDN